MARMRAMSGWCAAAALGLAACGGDFTSSGDPLSESEATDLGQALVEQGFVGLGGLSASPPAGAPGANEKAAGRVTVTLNDTAPCEGGGTVALAGKLTGDFNQTTGAGTITYDYTVAPAACKVTTTGGKVFTLTGEPNLKATGDFNWSSTSLKGSLSYDGKFQWESADSRSGSCGVNLSAKYEMTINSNTGATSGSATISGEVCGITVNRTVQFTV